MPVERRNFILLFVEGRPKPQGSKKAFAISKGGRYTGKVAMVEASDGLKEWRETVKQAIQEHNSNGLWEHDGTGLVIRYEFCFRRPKGHYRTGKYANQLKPSAPEHHLARPDLDKLIRAINDAATQSGAIIDDSYIVKDAGSLKRYASLSEKEGVRIYIAQHAVL